MLIFFLFLFFFFFFFFFNFYFYFYINIIYIKFPQLLRYRGFRLYIYGLSPSISRNAALSIYANESDRWG